jgi:hypothetical protein
MSLRGTKQSPIVGGDCFGKNALAMTFAKKAERTYLEDYTDWFQKQAKTIGSIWLE